MTARAFKPADAQRRAMIAKVKIAAKQLGLDDDTYRDLLQRITGCRSAADCSIAQLHDVLRDMQAKGWRPTAPTARRADHPAAGKARALWISLAQLGAIRDCGEAALEAFASRQLKVDRLQWADQAQVCKLIEALKAMAERAGWSQDLGGVRPEHHIAVLQQRLSDLIAQRREVGR